MDYKVQPFNNRNGPQKRYQEPPPYGLHGGTYGNAMTGGVLSKQVSKSSFLP
jgi:hypothetical protein